METVRLLEEHEFPTEQQKYFEATKAWFNIDYIPKMSKVLSYQPEMSHTHGRCSRRAMVDGALQRRQKEMIAVAVSAINACDYWIVAHTAAGKLQGYADDAYWYEAAYVYGVTNGINAVADGVRVPLDFSDGPGRTPLVRLIELEEASDPVKRIYQDIQAFYQTACVPNVFKVLAHDEGYLQDYWAAVRFVFTDRRLDRLTKEAVALAASMAAKSDYGVDLHMREVRRLGLSEKGVMEVIEVVQLFSCYTKIADGLQLEPDFTRLLEAVTSGAWATPQR